MTLEQGHPVFHTSPSQTTYSIRIVGVMPGIGYVHVAKPGKLCYTFGMGI